MGREDIDVSQEMRRILSDEGIQVHVAAELLKVQGRSGDKVSLLMRTASGEQKIQGSDILVAAGRVANTAGIGLDETGVKVDGRGYIRVNERLETTAAQIWAIGECATMAEGLGMLFSNMPRRSLQHVTPEEAA